MNKLSVVVTGDATLDCYVARNRRIVSEDGWNLNNHAQAFLQPGGSLLLGEVIETVAGKLSEQEKLVFDVRKIENVAMDLCSPNFHRSFAVWSQFDYANNPDSKKTVWRVEEFLGLQRSEGADPKILTVQEEPDLVIFDDANLGFRENEKLWKIVNVWKSTAAILHT